MGRQGKRQEWGAVSTSTEREREGGGGPGGESLRSLLRSSPPSYWEHCRNTGHGGVPAGQIPCPSAPLGLSACLKLQGSLRPRGACWVGSEGVAAGNCLPPAPPAACSLLKGDLSRTHPEPTRLGCEEGEGRFPLVGGRRRSWQGQHRKGPRRQETRGLFGDLRESPFA